MNRRFRQLMFAGKAAALLALLVACAGRIVHQHDVHGDCCKAPTALAALTETEPTCVCPFGCSHERPTRGPQDSESSQEKHDEHTCPVCSVLAKAPPVAAPVSLPQLEENVALLPPASALVPAIQPRYSYLTRGPPEFVS